MAGESNKVKYKVKGYSLSQYTKLTPVKGSAGKLSEGQGSTVAKAQSTKDC